MLLIVMLSSIAGSGSAFGGEFNPTGPNKIHEESRDSSTWYEKYLYFEMPEDEFVRLFTKDRLTVDSLKPQIINHKNNSYIIKDSKGTKYRITFENGLLVRFEKFGWEKIPFITAAYYDYTFFLRGYKSKNNPGFYIGMSEAEFLKIFSNSILSHSKNRYVVIGKNGWKYRITFSPEGFYIGGECIE